MPANIPEHTLVLPKALVEGMGLAQALHMAKVARHSVMGTSMSKVRVETIGRVRDNLALPLTTVPFWLGTIHPRKVLDLAARELVVHYQREAAQALFERRINSRASATIQARLLGSGTLLARMVLSQKGTMVSGNAALSHPLPFGALVIFSIATFRTGCQLSVPGQAHSFDQGLRQYLGCLRSFPATTKRVCP